MKNFLLILFLFSSICLTAAEKLSSINLIDRHGMTQTISEKERLSQFQKTNFLSPQPYQKVFRLFERDKAGNARAIITSYHPNGELKQYLDVMNNRAYGRYREWYSNGQLKIDSVVISGTADLHPKAQESWLFDDKSLAFDEEGHLSAEIQYSKGVLEGESHYYHANGHLWKVAPYSNNLLHGTVRVYLEDGSLFMTSDYVNGLKEGWSLRMWKENRLAFKEYYKGGLLQEADYFDKEGTAPLCSIREGKGFRALFGKEQLEEYQEYRGGIQTGSVQIFDEKGAITSTYATEGGEKEGAEIRYFPNQKKPHLLLTWHQGILQGPIKTWYESGILESEKEMSQNKKNGCAKAWYKNGSLLLIEEYENDRLISGEYYRPREKTPTSRVEEGKGTATIFDGEGNLLSKVHYHEGRPIEE